MFHTLWCRLLDIRSNLSINSVFAVHWICVSVCVSKCPGAFVFLAVCIVFRPCCASWLSEGLARSALPDGWNNPHNGSFDRREWLSAPYRDCCINFIWIACDMEAISHRQCHLDNGIISGVFCYQAREWKMDRNSRSFHPLILTSIKQWYKMRPWLLI